METPTTTVLEGKEILAKCRGKCAACLLPLYIKPPSKSTPPKEEKKKVRISEAPVSDDEKDKIEEQKETEKTITIDEIKSKLILNGIVYLNECKCYMHEQCFYEEAEKEWGIWCMPWNASFYCERYLDPAHLWTIAQRMWWGQHENSLNDHFTCPRCNKKNTTYVNVEPETVKELSIEDRLKNQVPSSITKEELRIFLQNFGGKRWKPILEKEDDSWIEFVERHEPHHLATLAPDRIGRTTQWTDKELKDCQRKYKKNKKATYQEFIF